MIHQHLVGQTTDRLALHLHVHGKAEPGRFFLEGAGFDAAGGAGFVTGADGELRALDGGRVAAVDLDGLGALTQVLGVGDIGIGDRHRPTGRGCVADIRRGGDGDAAAALMAQGETIDFDG